MLLCVNIVSGKQIKSSLKYQNGSRRKMSEEALVRDDTHKYKRCLFGKCLAGVTCKPIK